MSVFIDKRMNSQDSFTANFGKHAKQINQQKGINKIQSTNTHGSLVGSQRDFNALTINSASAVPSSNEYHLIMRDQPQQVPIFIKKSAPQHTNNLVTELKRQQQQLLGGGFSGQSAQARQHVQSVYQSDRISDQQMLKSQEKRTINPIESVQENLQNEIRQVRNSMQTMSNAQQKLIEENLLLINSVRQDLKDDKTQSQASKLSQRAP